MTKGDWIWLVYGGSAILLGVVAIILDRITHDKRRKQRVEKRRLHLLRRRCNEQGKRTLVFGWSRDSLRWNIEADSN